MGHRKVLLSVLLATAMEICISVADPGSPGASGVSASGVLSQAQASDIWSRIAADGLSTGACVPPMVDAEMDSTIRVPLPVCPRCPGDAATGDCLGFDKNRAISKLTSLLGHPPGAESDISALIMSVSSASCLRVKWYSLTPVPGDFAGDVVDKETLLRSPLLYGSIPLTRVTWQLEDNGAILATGSGVFPSDILPEPCATPTTTDGMIHDPMEIEVPDQEDVTEGCPALALSFGDGRPLYHSLQSRFAGPVFVVDNHSEPKGTSQNWENAVRHRAALALAQEAAAACPPNGASPMARPNGASPVARSALAPQQMDDKPGGGVHRLAFGKKKIVGDADGNGTQRFEHCDAHVKGAQWDDSNPKGNATPTEFYGRPRRFPKDCPWSQPANAGLFDEKGRCGQTGAANAFTFWGFDIPPATIIQRGSTCVDTFGTSPRTLSNCMTTIAKDKEIGGTPPVKFKDWTLKDMTDDDKWNALLGYLQAKQTIIVLVALGESCTGMHWMNLIGMEEVDGTKQVYLMDGNSYGGWPDISADKRRIWYAAAANSGSSSTLIANRETPIWVRTRSWQDFLPIFKKDCWFLGGSIIVRSEGFLPAFTPYSQARVVNGRYD